MALVVFLRGVNVGGYKKSAKVIEETMTAVYRFDTLVAAFLKDDAERTAAYNIARTVSRTKAHRTAVKESKAAPAPPVPPLLLLLPHTLMQLWHEPSSWRAAKKLLATNGRDKLSNELALRLYDVVFASARNPVGL